MALPVANAGADVIIAEGALPASQAFSGVASTPGTGGAAITGWAWTLLDKPVGSAAALADAATMTPTLNGIDTWGNYRLGLIVTDNLGAVSESNVLLAPDSAFVTFRVTAATTGLQKPAIGERNTGLLERAETQAVENVQKQLNNTGVADLADVSEATSTGPHLDHLMDGGYATQDGLEGGTALHVHPAGDIGPATTTVLGGVKLSDAPLDAANPVAVTTERFTICGNTEPTVKVVAPAGTLEILTWCGPDPAVESGFSILGMSMSMRDGGTIAGLGYRFKLYNMATGVEVADTGVIVPGADNAKIKKSVALGAPLVVASEFQFGVRVAQAPAGAPDQGVGLSIVLWCRRAH